MSGTVKKVKQVCRCENCNNEAEMVVTCTIDHDHLPDDKTPSKTKPGRKVQGTATCTNCGNEADMWIDI